MSEQLRILLQAEDPVRRQGLASMLQAAGHVLVQDAPDVVICDLDRDTLLPGEAGRRWSAGTRPA
jgi:DNA-binding NarL/FixJ family response regulator